MLHCVGARREFALFRNPLWVAKQRASSVPRECMSRPSPWRDRSSDNYSSLISDTTNRPSCSPTTDTALHPQCSRPRHDIPPRRSANEQSHAVARCPHLDEAQAAMGRDTQQCSVLAGIADPRAVLCPRDWYYERHGHLRPTLRRCSCASRS